MPGRFARRSAGLEQAGAQVLIAQGVEAGGHVRGYRPLHELLPEIAAETGLPVLAAGGLVDGADLATVLSLGAQGAVFGTALIATPKSFAHSYHKQRLIEAGDGDTVLCDAFHINWPRGEPARLATTARQPVSCHKRSNTRAAPIRRAGLVVASPSATAPTTMALSAKRAPTATAAPIARSGADLQATERGDDLLAHRPVLATVLDNLEIGATAGGLLSEKHGAEPRRQLIRGPHKSAVAPAKSSTICDYVAPRFRENAAPKSIISTICAPHSGRNCRRSARRRTRG